MTDRRDNGVSSYAVIMKTHFWDEFCERQLERLRKAAPSADFYIAIDETISRRVGEIGPNVLRLHDEDIAELGLPMVTTDGSAIWYNTDYPHYVFRKRHPEYDYYIFLEYDVLADVDLDAMIRDLRAEEIGYVGYKVDKALPDWPWHPLHQPIYGDDYHLSLSCFSAFSGAALDHLLRRRQSMARDFETGRLSFWPNNEAFLLTESVRGGFEAAFLDRFGDISRFDWWPPADEATLPTTGAPRFVHPLLSGSRYVRSRVSHEPNFKSLLNPRSALYTVDLKDHPTRLVRSIAINAIRARIRQSILSRLVRFGVGKPWYHGATPEGSRTPQREQRHNAA